MENSKDPDVIIQEAIRHHLPDNCLFDNMMMNQVFQDDIELIEHVLKIITRRGFDISSVKTQEKEEPNGSDTFIVLDICAKDKKGNLYDVEFQNIITDKQLCKRLRVYLTTMVYKDRQEQLEEWKKENEAKTKKERKKFKEVVHSKCVIFLVNRKQGKSKLYRFDDSHILKEKQRKGVIHRLPVCMYDEFYIIYMKDVEPSTELGDFIHDLLCSNPPEIRDTKIRDVVDSYQKRRDQNMSSMRTSRRFHEAVKDEVFTIAHQIGVEEGKEIGVEQGKQIGVEQGKQIGVEQGKQIGLEQGKQIGIEKGEQIGIEKGEHRNKLQNARTMIADGLCDEKIVLYTGLSLTEIQKLRDEKLSEKE